MIQNNATRINADGDNNLTVGQPSLNNQIRLSEENANLPGMREQNEMVDNSPMIRQAEPDENAAVDVRPSQRATGTETDGSTVETTRLQEDEDISARSPEQQRYDSQTQKGEVGSLTEVLNTPSGEHSFVTLLKGVSNKAKKVIKDAIGVDVSGYSHTIDSSSIKHVLNGHANDAIPLSPQDFNLVPDIIKNADSVEYSGKNNRGLDVITYTKQYNNKIAYLEEIRNGRHQLTMNTMYWIGKGQQKSGPTGEFSENSTNSPRALPRPAGDTTNNISQNTESVNSSGRNYEAETSEGLPEDFDVKRYVSDQVKAQKARSKVPLRERIADTTAELKHYLLDDAVVYERYEKGERRFRKELSKRL